MAIYVDVANVPDINNIQSNVFRYLIKKHKAYKLKLQRNYDYYIGKHKIITEQSEDKEQIRVYSNYAKYVVDISTGYYLGEPIKYNEKNANSKQNKQILNAGTQATVKNGNIFQYDWDNTKEVDISRVIEVYDNQTISECDSKIAKYLGIFGECYELEYANSWENPEPRTTIIDPRNCIMVRDNTVEHNKLFALVYQEQETLGETKYYDVTVYTAFNSKKYRSTNLEDFEFNYVPDSEELHYFGEVPIVEYQNNDERQGDYEQCIPLIDGLNELLSDRLTDKKKFVNSILAMFGITIDDDDLKVVRDEKYLDGIPTDARIEYIQKVFDEGSMNVLCNDIIREIHKMTLTVDMTDESFAGNSSGQALMLKLMTMNILVKSKMRNFEKGLKKRFEMYNTWLTIKGEMLPIDKKEVDIIFTVALPIDKAEILSTVTQLQGIVDNKTLLSQLWFVKDVDVVLENLRVQKEEAQQEYLDSFARQKALQMTFDGSDGEEQQDEEKEQGEGENEPPDEEKDKVKEKGKK